MKNKNSLNKLYNDVVDDYVRIFCSEYGLEEYNHSMWVADEIGGILCASDYFINFRDIKYCVDNDVPWQEFVKWYDYCLDLGIIDTEISTPNLDSWVHGCPRMSTEEIKRLKSAKNFVEDAKDNLKKEIINVMGKNKLWFNVGDKVRISTDRESVFKCINGIIAKINTTGNYPYDVLLDNGVVDSYNADEMEPLANILF